METENRDHFVSLKDPFHKNERIGLVRSLVPDISFYHGLAADPQGNTLFAPPYAENLYGALASRKGVLVTVEKIVSTKFIRDHAGFVRLPGNRVLSVSEVPLGGHPASCNVHGIRGIEGYAVDNPFVLEWRRACKKTETLDAWMKEWVHGCPDRSSYLEARAERVRELRERSHPDSWKDDLKALTPQPSGVEPANPMDGWSSPRRGISRPG